LVMCIRVCDSDSLVIMKKLQNTPAVRYLEACVQKREFFLLNT